MSEDNGVERRVSNEARFVRLEGQVDRLVSDAESEKETRRRAHERIDQRFDNLEQRLSALEKKLYMASGALALLVTIVNVLT